MSETFTVRQNKLDVLIYNITNKISHRHIDTEIEVKGDMEILEELRNGLERYTYDIRDRVRA